MKICAKLYALFLHGCEKYFNFRKNQYFENDVLTRTSGPKLQEVT